MSDLERYEEGVLQRRRPLLWRDRRRLHELEAVSREARALERAEAARIAERLQCAADLAEGAAAELRHLRHGLSAQAKGVADELDVGDLLAVYRDGVGRLIRRYLGRP